MLQEGIVDRNVKFTPVLDGYRMPEYIDWELQPFTDHKASCTSWLDSPLCQHVQRHVVLQQSLLGKHMATAAGFVVSSVVDSRHIRCVALTYCSGFLQNAGTSGLALPFSWSLVEVLVCRPIVT